MRRHAVRFVLLILLAVLIGSCKEDGGTGVPIELPPFLTLTTPSVAVTLRGANDSVTQTVGLQSGPEPTSWTASSPTPWVRVNLPSGTTPSTISITARSAGLAPGTHTGVVTFTAPDAMNSPIHLVVNATVEAQPILVVPTDTLTFTGTAGQAEAGQRTLSITNGGTGTLAWTASSTSSWIRVTPTGGTGIATLNIAAGAVELAAGTHHGTVTITATGATGSPKVVPVKLVLVPRMFSVTAAANPANGGTVTGAGSYAQGSTARVDATAANGFDFTSWTENGVVVSNAASYSFAVTADRSLTANFTARPVIVTITTASQPAAGGTTTGAGTYAVGTAVSLQATPTAGNTFVSWTEGGTVVSTNANYSFVATVSRNLVANFQAAPATTIYTVAATAAPVQGGTVTGAGTYVAGTSATLTATANPAYRFISWTENGAVVATTPIYTHVVTMDRSLVANFADSASIYTVSASASPTEGGTVSGAGTYVQGTSATLTATPNPNYSFVNWTDNGAGVSTAPTFTYVVTGNRTLVANFQAGPPPPIYTIFASANPFNGGAVSGAGTYVPGTTATLTATPQRPYTFLKSWTENGVVVSTDPSYTFVVTRERRLVANFSALFTVTAIASPPEGGTITGAGTYEIETDATLTAIPTTGWTFKEWRESGGRFVSNQPTRTTRVRSDTTLIAYFLPPGFIEISFIEPRVNSLHGDSLFINVAVTSSHAITSVTATVEGRTVPLSPFPQRWMGNLNLAGLASGPKNVVITATNSFGNTVTASQPFMLDRLPVITATAPMDGDVARPTINYSATCSDDDPAGCTSLTLAVFPPNQPQVVLATGTNSLNGVADLSVYNGQTVMIRYTAVDSRGQVSRRDVQVRVE